MSQPECKEPGHVAPVIDRNRCESKPTACACAPTTSSKWARDGEQCRGLSFIGKLKAFGHGGRQAFAVRGGACHACGLCVTACPEHAITLAGV